MSAGLSFKGVQQTLPAPSVSSFGPSLALLNDNLYAAWQAYDGIVILRRYHVGYASVSAGPDYHSFQAGVSNLRTPGHRSSTALCGMGSVARLLIVV